MATNVIVLAPNGRRQNVKVTPNSTILQILEEVCRKQGFNANEYDIKHHRNVLDTSILLRFSGLPNNAQLELVPAMKIRSEGTLVLGVHLEDGRRLTGNFTPSNTLLDVLNNLCPNDLKSNAVIIYMRREVHGDALKETCLRDLGLTSGRAMIRLIHKTPEELKTQANVSAPLPVKPVEEKPYIRTLKKIETPPPLPLPIEEGRLPKPCLKGFQEEEHKGVSERNVGIKENVPDNLKKIIKQEKRKQTDKQPIKSSKNKITILEPAKNDEEFVFLGERDAMLFSCEMAKSVHSEDLPDDFFDLTIDDAKKLLKDLKKQRLSLENGKLATSAMRRLEDSKKQLRLLNQYKKSIIRVQFPDRTVLQGTFLPAETISNVMHFVREYLEDKQCEFHLYTTPPKEILNLESKLIDVGFIPGALVHFGVDILKQDNKYLRSDLANKLTTPSVASLAATKTRKEATRNIEYKNDFEDDDDNLVIAANDVNVGASTSAASDYEMKPPAVPEKVPKWFKTSK